MRYSVQMCALVRIVISGQASPWSGEGQSDLFGVVVVEVAVWAGDECTHSLPSLTDLSRMEFADDDGLMMVLFFVSFSSSRSTSSLCLSRLDPQHDFPLRLGFCLAAHASCRQNRSSHQVHKDTATAVSQSYNHLTRAGLPINRASKR